VITRLPGKIQNPPPLEYPITRHPLSDVHATSVATPPIHLAIHPRTIPTLY
jgi:hypothetical protein